MEPAVEEIFGVDKCSITLSDLLHQNCDRQARPRQMRALMILKIILESNRRDKWSRAPSLRGRNEKCWLQKRLPWPGSGCTECLSACGSSCRPEPWICIVLSEEQAQDGTFRIPQFGLALNAREGPGSVTYKCSELQGRVSQLWPCWQFGLDNSSGAVPYTAL